jgi:hypothetical protein
MLIIALIASILAIILGVRCTIKLHASLRRVKDIELNMVQDQIITMWLAGNFYEVANQFEKLDPEVASVIKDRLKKSQIPDREILLKLI